ncbi:hypothetical protein Tco_0778614, partial [Tanacetum coccineum]
MGLARRERGPRGTEKFIQNTSFVFSILSWKDCSIIHRLERARVLCIAQSMAVGRKFRYGHVKVPLSDGLPRAVQRWGKSISARSFFNLLSYNVVDFGVYLLVTLQQIRMSPPRDPDKWDQLHDEGWIHLLGKKRICFFNLKEKITVPKVRFLKVDSKFRHEASRHRSIHWAQGLDYETEFDTYKRLDVCRGFRLFAGRHRVLVTSVSLLPGRVPEPEVEAVLAVTNFKSMSVKFAIWDCRMPPKRTSTSAAPAMTQAAIKKLVAD